MPAVLKDRENKFKGLATLVFLCLVMLTACKKDTDNTDTGGASLPPVSLLSAETLPAAAPPPAATSVIRGFDAAAVSVNAGTAPPTPVLPDMVNVPGTDISVRLSARMKNTPGWNQQFATYFHDIHLCLTQVDGGAAYVTEINSADPHNVIDLYGLDAQAYRCTVQNGHATVAPRTVKAQSPLHQVMYFPRVAGAPVIERPQCYDVEAVVARPQGLIGWMAFLRADCGL